MNLYLTLSFFAKQGAEGAAGGLGEDDV